jgi:hypothetical protein
MQATKPITTTEKMPNQMAQQELEYYLNIPPEQWPRFEDTLSWWNSRTVADNMPCFLQVANALLSCTPSSGGLECDFGLLKDVVKSKQASLSQGFVGSFHAPKKSSSYRMTNGKTSSQNARTRKMQIQMAMTKEKEQPLMKSSKKKERQSIVLANIGTKKMNEQIPILTL